MGTNGKRESTVPSGAELRRVAVYRGELPGILSGLWKAKNATLFQKQKVYGCVPPIPAPGKFVVVQFENLRRRLSLKITPKAQLENLRRRRSLIRAQGWSAATTLGPSFYRVSTLKGFAVHKPFLQGLESSLWFDPGPAAANSGRRRNSEHLPCNLNT